MTRIQLTWRDVWYHFDPDCGVTIYDEAGTAWTRTKDGSPWRDALHRDTEHGITYWNPDDSEPVWVDPAPLPEPPDGTRIEFEHNTDVYAAWRDDDSSQRAGYSTGDGGEVWCLFGRTVPQTWTVMWLAFGDSLRTAVRLVPHPDDRGNYDRWPTSVLAAAERGSR